MKSFISRFHAHAIYFTVRQSIDSLSLQSLYALCAYFLLLFSFLRLGLVNPPSLHMTFLQQVTYAMEKEIGPSLNRYLYAT